MNIESTYLDGKEIIVTDTLFRGIIEELSSDEDISVFSKILLYAGKVSDGPSVYFVKGTDITQDDYLSFECVKKAAENNNSWALERLGFLLYYGVGVKQNLDAAVACYEAAAKNGNTLAQLKLSELNIPGRNPMWKS